ncbi:MAG: glycosyltransferase, partial [Spirochaetia bacterium]
ISFVARSIDPERFDVRLVLMLKTGPFLAELPDSLEVHDLRASRARYAFPALVRAVRNRKPDVILSTLGYLNLLVAIARPLLPRRTRLVAREANTVTDSNASQAHPRLLDALYRRYYHRYDQVVCQSLAMARDLHECYRVPPGTTTIIYNPVDSRRIRAAADAPAPGTSANAVSDERSLAVLAVGRLVPQKGFDLLLEAVSKTAREVDLTIAGQGPQLELLQNMAERLLPETRVSFAGFIENPWRLMVRSDVLVLPSRYEGLPNVVLEAGALGLPVIAFDCPGGTREIVNEKENGLLVPCGDIDALARAIDRFDRAWFDAGSIRDRVSREHCPEVIVGKYESLLEHVAQ